jgi:hypothetical protein
MGSIGAALTAGQHFELPIIPFGHRGAESQLRPYNRALSGGRFILGEYQPVMFLTGCLPAQPDVVGGFPWHDHFPFWRSDVMLAGRPDTSPSI